RQTESAPTPIHRHATLSHLRSSVHRGNPSGPHGFMRRSGDGKGSPRSRSNVLRRSAFESGPSVAPPPSKLPNGNGGPEHHDSVHRASSGVDLDHGATAGLRARSMVRLSPVSELHENSATVPQAGRPISSCAT